MPGEFILYIPSLKRLFVQPIGCFNNGSISSRYDITFVIWSPNREQPISIIYLMNYTFLIMIRNDRFVFYDLVETRVPGQMASSGTL